MEKAPELTDRSSEQDLVSASALNRREYGGSTMRAWAPKDEHRRANKRSKRQLKIRIGPPPPPPAAPPSPNLPLKPPGQSPGAISAASGNADD